jgi:glycosyltransferase involved in cell wall biosynthesis
VTGGDFSRLPRIGPLLPELASVYLEAPLVKTVAEFARQGQSLVAAIRSSLDVGLNRVVRYAPLDVFHDSAMRVLQVVTSLQRGGAERIALDLARGLDSCGLRSRLVVLGKPTRSAFPQPPGTVDLSSMRGGRADRWPALTRTAATYAADLIHCHLLKGEDLACIATIGLPIVVTVHNVRPGWPQGLEHLREGVGTLLLACALAVEADLRRAELPHPIRTVWNGVDFTPFKPTPALRAGAHNLRSELGIGSHDCVLLALANPRQQKRLDRLPAILAATQAAFLRNGIDRQVHLVVAGEASHSSGEARQALAALQAEITRRHLESHAHVIGPTQCIAPLLASANILVSTSAYEGLSLAHLEALAAGLSVVATDAGGTAEIARNNPAMSVLPLDADAELFAEALVRCANMASTEGRSAAAFHFTQRRMIERHAFLYPRAIAAAQKRGPGSGLMLVINNFSTGGAQSSARRLLLGLAAQGIHVRAAVLEEDATNPTPGLRALRAAGVDVEVLPRAGTIDPTTAVCQLFRRIDEVEPAAVLLWNALTEYKVLLADGLLDIPLYDVSPGEMYYVSLERFLARPRPGLPYREAREYGARLRAVIVKYGGEADLARRTLGAPVHVIPNGISVTEPVQCRCPNSGPLVFGTAVRISPQKKLEDLLTAVRRASDRLAPFVLRIAGGPERGSADYEQQLRRLAEGLPVEWVGELADVRPFLRDLDVFALVAEPAGCPNASLEAMAEGLPVIATAVGGMGEQVVDGVTGRLVPRGELGLLADALVEAASCPARRVRWGQAARSRIASHFTVERMIANYRRVCLDGAATATA